MEKRLKRIEIITAITLILLVVNLIFTLKTKSNSPNLNETEVKENKEPPSDITRQFSDKVLYKIKTDFNLSAWLELYDVLGEFAKAQISEEQVSTEFTKLKSATGKINTYAYSHYIYEGNSNNAEWFEIHYKCRFDNGKGTIKISTRTVEGISEIVGFVINLDEL